MNFSKELFVYLFNSSLGPFSLICFLFFYFIFVVFVVKGSKVFFIHLRSDSFTLSFSSFYMITCIFHEIFRGFRTFQFLGFLMKIGFLINFEPRANRNPKSSSSSSAYFDNVRFLTDKCEDTYETLTKYRSIWGERDIVLSELDPSIRKNFVSRNWVSLWCEVSDPPPAALIREFYSNLSVYSEAIGGHYLTSWIRGHEFTINKQIVFEALGVPIVRKPTYPYIEFPTVDDMISWGYEPRINSCEFIELNSLYLRITCHNIYPISHVHTVPIERCAFLYAFFTNGSVFSFHVDSNHC